MLASVVPRLRCAVCVGHDAQLDLVPFTQGGAGHIQDGVLVCRRCHSWFPIQDDLLELVEPGLLDADARGRFEERFGDQLAAAVTAPGAAPVSVSEDTPQIRQRRHFDRFASDSTLNYDEYQDSRFWRAADAATFGRWIPGVGAGSWILDIGCANGRSAWPLAATGATLIGFDISRRLVAQAIEHAKRRALHPTTTFMVADADHLPFETGAFDAAVTYGVLHHLPNPGGTARDIQRIVKVGGVHLGSENNKSAFRRVFDLLMKIKPLWIEEAGEEPLISEAMIREWLAGVPASVQVATHVFVPPHLINALPDGWGAALLTLTDAIGSRLPLVRHHGGLIVFSAKKMASYDGH